MNFKIVRVEQKRRDVIGRGRMGNFLAYGIGTATVTFEDGTVMTFERNGRDVWDLDQVDLSGRGRRLFPLPLDAKPRRDEVATSDDDLAAFTRKVRRA